MEPTKLSVFDVACLIENKLLAYPVDNVTWAVNLFLPQHGSVTRLLLALFIAITLLYAQFLGFWNLAQSILPLPPIDLLSYGPILILMAFGGVLRANYGDRFSNLIATITKYIKWLLAFIYIGSIVSRNIGFVSLHLGIVQDCLAAVYISETVVLLGNFHFRPKTLEPAPLSEDHSGYVSEPYNFWKFRPREAEVPLSEFDAFRSGGAFGAVILKDYWYTVIYMTAVQISFALSIWTGDEHIMLAILNIMLLLYVLAPTMLSILKISSSCHPRKSAIYYLLNTFYMLDLLVLLLAMPISRISRFVLEVESRYGWSDVGRTLALLEALMLLVPPLVKFAYTGTRALLEASKLLVPVLDQLACADTIVLAKAFEFLVTITLIGLAYACVLIFWGAHELLASQPVTYACARVKSFFLPGPGRREWFVLGSLSGVRVLAIPDTGSDLDIVSFDFVKRNGIMINSTTVRSIQLPNGTTVSTGSVTLPFSFEGERSTFSRVFTVMPNCLHDVILSNSFLRTTETLTKFSRRLRSRFVPSLHTPCLRLLGVPKQRIWGSINGRTVAAVPDTGSDVMLMSKRYARKLRLKISKSTAHSTCLEFADGTLANTCGMVFGVEWRFGGQDSTSQYCDFHIMEDLPYKVILSNAFLFKAKAFSKFKEFFFEQRNDADLSRAFHELSLIKIVGPQNKTISRIHGFYRRFLRVVKGNTTGDLIPKESRGKPTEREESLRRELQRQDGVEEIIAELSPEQQEAAWAAERRCREQWTKTHPP